MSKGVSLVIDGMTGVGKTSLMDILVEKIEITPYREIFRDENDLLGKFFTQGNRWCFPMQVSFLNNRFNQYQEACTMTNALMDRSIFSDPIFADFYHRTGAMEPEEYFVYRSLFRTLVETLEPPKLVVYLDVSADEALRRIRMRGRADELQMPESYWRDLHSVYTEYYDNYQLSPLLRIDVSACDFVNDVKDRAAIVRQIVERLG
ncbi:deoxynucleoside kinase [Heliophilum fasciatum]|uniref:Deoxyadenosine/deoxycytidine kinase n=1 Tax=Heliophilum fasciatum TaxID=35700 RepID=A0A4R2RPC8_9FIRM|nr:deoxynucleoside kinase [Heliophilum fasciatum]MCW2277605.1 deoxyadenosine/deoxycytidine kinase [Heliophilum fasciatum]TCP64954.1 deoxyadenosine/deoxycytidine kinase [Heliophilum fasciatum]